MIAARGIEEVLHFTTNRGLLGVLHSRAILSKTRLGKEQQLEYIFKSNTAFRKDVAWLDYVNLSISSINSAFFDVSANRWHKDEDIWWCILSLSPGILSHPGVYFTTTNNMYTSVEQTVGEAGLNNMFSPRIVQWNTSIVIRPTTLPSRFPTCEQAEVLYPQMVSTEFLKSVYVRSETDADEISGQLALTSHRDIDLIVDPLKFESRTW